MNQKYMAYLVMFIAYGFMNFATSMGVEHNLFVYGADPGWEYSDMRRFGPFLAPVLTFKLYWGAWALLLAIVARLLVVRGKEDGLASRIAIARARSTRSVIGGLATATALILTLGGLVFYNTNVLNAYNTTSERAAWSAGYEQRYGKYASASQPAITRTKLQVEIYPDERRVEIDGTYRLVNRTGAAIDSLHLANAADVATRNVRFDRRTANVATDSVFRHAIFVLETPLQPGDSLEMSFHVQFDPRGFPNSDIDASVAASATYFVAQSWLPAIGYQAGREARWRRRAAGVPTRSSSRGARSGRPRDAARRGGHSTACRSRDNRGHQRRADCRRTGRVASNVDRQWEALRRVCDGCADPK